MTQDISGFGLRVSLIASITFPTGIILSQFADDTDPLDLNAIDIADKGMGLNGDLITWSKAVPLPLALSVIPGSTDDANLQIIADANRVGAGKFSARDLITATIIYPDLSQITLINGKMTTAMFGRSIASTFRQKTKVYGFAFENKVGG